MGKTKNAILDMVDWARAGRSVLVTGKPGSGKTSVSVNEFMAAMAEHLSVGRKTWAKFYKTGRMA